MHDLVCFKPFAATMERLSGRHQLERVFADFLALAVCAFHPQTVASPGIDPDADNEAEYLAIAGRYTRDELNAMGELLAIATLQANIKPYSDLLGEYFQQHVTRGRNGQYFTPDNICRMMAQMTGGEACSGKTVNDPACGSGRMLLAFAEDAPANLFFAGDVDVNCARMTALNFYLNGMRGEVVCMNALTLDAYRAWHINDGRRGIAPIPLEKAWQVPGPPVHAAPAPPRPKPAEPKPAEPAFVPRLPASAPPAAGVQLGLF